MKNRAKNTDRAYEILKQFKGDRYIHGLNCMEQIGGLVNPLGRRIGVVAADHNEPWMQSIIADILRSLELAGLKRAGEIIPGARPNAPVEDVLMISSQIGEQGPDAVIAVGGGSTIDAVKAAGALHALKDTHGNLHDYFGVGQVQQMLRDTGQKLLPMVAVQMAASSAAHLTKYSNVTDLSLGQKMLIVDEAVVPPAALFDYGVTQTQPVDLTRDGGLDGVSHCLEVFMGVPGELLNRVRETCLLGIDLICGSLQKACEEPGNMAAREAIGLGTDLGGYSIMVGGTNGAHLNSFSLTDILSHGRACALMNPYYVVFFSNRIEDRLREVGKVYRAHGFLKGDLEKLKGTDLGKEVAGGMIEMSRQIGFPVTLSEVEGFSKKHITRCLAAAKNPKLESKLKNMPVSITVEMVDEYMGSVLEAARTGDLSIIKAP